MAIPRPTRSRRIPCRADEVVSHAPRATAESSAPPEPVIAATATIVGANLEVERQWAEALESNADDPIAVDLPTRSDSGGPIQFDGDVSLDEEMPGLDSPAESSEDEGPGAAFLATEDRAAPIALAATPTPVVTLAARPRPPAVQETEEGMRSCHSPTFHTTKGQPVQ